MQNSNRIELERGAHVGRSHAQLRALRRLAARLLRRLRRAVVKALLNDWTVSTIVTLQSGTPLTITSGQDRNFDGLTNDRADIIGDPKLDSGRPREELIEQWFNIAAFAQPAHRRRRHRRPQHRRRARAIATSTSACSATSGLAGRTMLQFRVEATNVFNIVNLHEPGHEPQRAGDVRQDPHGARHAEDSAGRAVLVLSGRG